MNASLDVLPPHDDAAEAGALACILSLAPEEAAEKLTALSLDLFYDTRHRNIYNALQAIAGEGKPPGEVNLYQQLKFGNQLDGAGGLDYVTRLPEKTHSPAHFPAFLETLHDFAKRRAALAESARLWRDALDGLPASPPEKAAPPVETDDQVLTRLTALAPLEYDRQRVAAAKQLGGIRASLLDKLVASRRPDNAGEPMQGRTLNLADAEPWPDSVDGADVLARLADAFSRYVALPDGAADALAMWTAHAHCFQSFVCSPRLNISSPEKGCGKTTLRDVVAALVPRPLPTENLSAPVLFRVIESRKPTVLADECDAWLRDNEELRGMLNAGHRRGGQALRCEGDSHEVRAFNVFAPAVLCGIGALPGTLHDRSIVIRLERAKPGELRQRFDSRRTECEQELCRKLARWSADHRERLMVCDPVLPAGAFNRLADNWRPLFAIAEVAGGEWPQRAAIAFAKLTGRDDSDAQGIGAALLADIRDTFAEAGLDRLPSAQIVSTLGSMEGREWAEFGRARKPISTNQLAKLLHRFDIAPRTIKLADGTTAKGYHLGLFADAFARYLPPTPSQTVTGVTTPVNIDENPLSEPSPENAGLRLQTAISANKDGLGYAGYGSEPAVSAKPREVLL